MLQARSYISPVSGGVKVQIRDGLTIQGEELFSTTQPTQDMAVQDAIIWAKQEGWTIQTMRGGLSSAIRICLSKPYGEKQGS